MYRLWNLIIQYSLLMILGTIVALVWANVDSKGYHSILNFVLLDNSWIGQLADSQVATTRSLSVHYLINDVFMALFFAVAGKEVWEAIALRQGSLRGRKAFTPLIATVGGMLGPIAVYLGLAAFLGSDTYDAVARGWAIPTATDIAFSYFVARIIFGANHPAIRFLLLLAIADDAGGLLILAVFYPSGDLAPFFLLASFAVAIFTFVAFNWLPRHLDRANPNRPRSRWVRQKLAFWPYAVAGLISWFCFQASGIHPALGLLPIIPTIPHGDHDFGIFADAELKLKDLLNTAEHALRVPVQIVLFAFGFANAGIELASFSTVTWLVLLGLLVGKPVGIFAFGWLAARPLALGLPQGMNFADLFVVGFVAAIGFTVALFVASVAFNPGPLQDGAKMGALCSIVGALIAYVVARRVGVKKA